MSSLMIPVISETLYSATYWYAETYLGLQEGALQKGLKLLDFRMNAEETIPESIINNLGIPILLLGTSTAWIDSIAEKAQKLGLRTLVVGGSLRTRRHGVSSIYLDYYAAINDVVYYLQQCGRERIALLGINPASAVDIEKAEGYKQALYLFTGCAPTDAVFYNNGYLEDSVSHFINHIDRFDAVICSNDIVALALVQRLKDINSYSPERLFVVGFGATLLGELSAPPLTTVTLNYRDVGKQAAHIWKDLMFTPAMLAVACTVECKIIPRETTLFCSVVKPAVWGSTSPISKREDNLFFNDLSVRELLLMEEMLLQMDYVDCCVLTGVFKGMTYESIAEQLSISDGTVKYRLKRIIKTAGVKTKEELIACMDRRVGLSALEKLKEKKML